jgi:S-adenosylmethionine hydrolase
MTNRKLQPPILDGDPRIVLTTDCSNDNDIQRMTSATEYVRACHRRLITQLRVIRDVEPYSILDGAFHLGDQARTWQWAQPIHVGVVDPGVGTDRRGIAFRSQGGTFVGPDNGVSTLFRKYFPAEKTVELDPDIRSIVPKDFDAPTFDGERWFCPAAALLSVGETLEGIGKEIDPASLQNIALEEGTILHTDKDFQNLKLFGLDHILEQIRHELAFTVSGSHLHRAKKGRTLADGIDAPFVVYPGSSSFVELAIYKGFAARELGVKTGDRILPDLANSI